MQERDAAVGGRYVVDPEASRFTVQAFAGGMLSVLGHNPIFVARDFAGDVSFDPSRPNDASLTMTMQARSLTLVDVVSEADREVILRTMHEKVLESAKFPEITYACRRASTRAVRAGQADVALDGQLTLHGVTRSQPIAASLSVTGPILRASGVFTVLQSDYDIKPLTIAASMLKVKDQLTCAFDIAAKRVRVENTR